MEYGTPGTNQWNANCMFTQLITLSACFCFYLQAGNINNATFQDVFDDENVTHAVFAVSIPCSTHVMCVLS